MNAAPLSGPPHGRPLGAIIGLFLLLAAFPACAREDRPPAKPYAFHQLKLGGGGFVVDMASSSDGETLLARTDVYGAYIWDRQAERWTQLVTASSLPADDPLLLTGGGIGVYAVGVAPGLSTRLYIVLPGISEVPSTVYRSDDRGAHWRKTGFKPAAMTVQSAGRMLGPKMAIDPRDPDTVYLGDSAGIIHVTHDGGASWETIEASVVPIGEEPAIVFDPSSQTLGGRSTSIFVATGRNGVYRSSDGGRAWARTPGGPASIARIAAAADGAIYATDRDEQSVQNAWKFTGGSWVRLSAASPGPGNYWHSVAVEPRDPKHVVLGSQAGNISSSFDGGSRWSGFHPEPAARVARDIPWLAWTREDWMTNGTMIFDPLVANKLYFAEGIGVWVSTPPRDSSRPTWISQTAGIEELIVNDLIVPPGQRPLVAVQDRGIFRIEDPDAFPSLVASGRDVPIRHGWALDYASGNPSFIAAIVNGGAADRSGYSTDGGRTWTPFGSQAPASSPGNLGGSIAVSTPENIVWAPANNGQPFYTLDGGKSWHPCEFPKDVPTAGELGWSFSLYQNRHVFAAEREAPHIFYAYNYGPGGSSAIAGVYASTDGGQHWTRVAAGFGTPGGMGSGARLASVPGHAGHLFFAAGTTGLNAPHPYDFPLQRSIDGGRNWAPVRKTQEAWAVGFGKPTASDGYPVIYIAGYANGEKRPGLFVSDDDCASWRRISDFPSGSLDPVRAISGDPASPDTVYFGLSGSGAGYGKAQ